MPRTLTEVASDVAGGVVAPSQLRATDTMSLSPEKAEADRDDLMSQGAEPMSSEQG